MPAACWAAGIATHASLKHHAAWLPLRNWSDFNSGVAVRLFAHYTDPEREGCCYGNQPPHVPQEFCLSPSEGKTLASNG